MRRFLTLIVLILASHYAFSQTEICNNGIDDDFDGFIDCYDGSCANSPLCDGLFLGNDAACEAVPPAFPQFTMSLDFSSPNETTNHLSRLAIGDLDRDGIPEMVTMNRYTKKIYILNGNNGTVKFQKTVSWEPYWEIAIANIDNDACGEIFFIGHQNLSGSSNDGVYIFAYDCQLNKLWETAKKLPGDPINFGLADFDNDGKVELYAKDEIYDAKTGVRIVKSTASSYTRFNGGPVAANIVGDDKLELIAGLNIYQVNLGARTLDAGSLTLLQNRTEYFTRFEYNATSIADYNLDGFLDVLASGSTISNGKNTTVFFWDVKNNTIKTYADFQPALGTNYEFGWVNGTGRLNIADLDGNGKMNASYVSGRFLYALDENFNLLWRVNINEETSGHTGCTLFDFNGDGKAEIVYRDERFIYIIEGTDGSVYSQQACISRTNREYPIVADVDADGSTELCVPCGFNDANSSANFNDLDYSRYSHIRVFKSAAEPWVPARRVWNQHGYFVVNVNDDLTIPKKLQPHQLVFSTGNCTQGPNRPLNKFLNQSPYLNSEGCPTYAAPDIAFHVAPTIVPPTCPDLNFKVSFKITNLGDVAVTGNIPVSFYSSDPMQAGATKLATINIAVTALANGDIVSVDNQTVTGIGSQFVYVVLNDAGTSVPTPIVLPNTNFIECDYDNIRFAQINPLPVAITGVPVSASETCTSTANGVARAFVPISGGGENTADYNFYWSNGTTGKPIASADFIGPVYSGLAPGSYTVYARHKTANCNSDTTTVVIGSTTAPFPPITINVLSDQTTCSPFNGKLQAVIQGGGAGYSIDWYDIALNSLGISGPTASNLQAGSYLAVISKGTCNTSVPATVNPPTVPDATASVLQDVVDCSNPNSGSVTAEALVSGVVQNAANYTFTWYEYDNTNSARGSILPGSHGTGKTRTGLPVGFYQVEVKENASQCASTITPIVEIESDLDIPDAPQIVIISSQTSCDPLHPNGVMTANVTLGGVAQNPADFTFEWFKGQNTLAANKVTTVSDVNGKTVNQVAGGGIPYTVRVTNAFNCSSVADLPVTENIITPVVTLAQLTPNTVCDPAKATTPYNGSLQASVTFNGSNVTLPDNNYTFEWRNPANAIIAVADNKNPVLTGLRDGNSYSITVRRVDLACVSAPDTEPVTKATVLPALATTSTGSNTCDPLLTPDGTATVSVTNSVPADAFTFRWHSGNAVVPANVLPAANNFNQATAIKLGGVTGSPNPYTVLVLNTRTGCENTATQFVSDESVIPVLAFGLIKPNTICAPATSFNGEMNVQVTNIPAGYTIADYTFRWFDGQTPTTTLHVPGSTTTQLTGLDAAFYTVDGTNTKTGCKSAPISNQVPNGKIFPALLPASTGSNNCDALLTPDGTVSYSVTNIQPGDAFSQQWYNGSAVTAGQELPAGNNGTAVTAIKLGGPVGAPKPYTVLVTNTVTGCTNSTTAAVPDISIVPTLSTSVVANSICAPSTSFSGSFTANVTNIPSLYTIADYDFTFRNAANTIVQASSPDNSLNNVDAGAYSVVGRNRLTGCQSAPANNNVPNTKIFPDLTPSSTGSTNCIVDVVNGIVNNGTATVAVGVTAGPHTFQWYTGTGDPIANALPTLGSGHAETSSTATFLGGPVGAPNAYTVLVTDVPSGCTSFTTALVANASVNPVLALGPITPNTICSPSTSFDGSITTSVTNIGSFVLTDFDFTWFDGNNTATPHATQPPAAIDHQLTQLDAAQYTVRGYNTKTGCTSAPITGTVPNGKVNPVISITTTGSHNCTNTVDSDGTATATVTNNGLGDPMSFAWNAVAPTTAINNGTNHANLATAIKLGGPVNAPNTYNVLVTNTRTGCFNNSQALVADISAKPVPVLAAFDNHVCNPALISPGAQQFDGHVDVTGVNHNGAPYLGTDLTYEWFNVNAMTNVVGASTGVTTVSLPNQNAGKYAVRVRMTGLDCTSDFVIDQVVNDLDAPVITSTTSPNINCPGGGINANGSAAVTFVDGNAVPSTYSYQWYNGSIVDPGQIRAGDTNPLLGNQLGNAAATPLPFIVEVTNRLTGCVNSQPMTVTDARVTPSIDVTLVTNNINCSGTPSGALLATPANAGAGFTITWTPPVTIVGNQNTELPAGAYSATVRNNVTGCVSPSDGESIIDVFTFPTVAIAVQPQSTCSGTPNGSLAATDNLSSTFTWFDGIGTGGATHAQTGVNSGIINQLIAADFTVRAVAAGTGCTTIRSETVPTSIVYPVLTLTPTDVTNCTTPNGQIAFSQTGLQSTTSYTLWVLDEVGNATTTNAATIQVLGNVRAANADPIPNFTGLAPGYFTAMIRDENTQCSSQPVSTEIAPPDFPTITINSIAAGSSCGAGSTGGIDATVAGGSGVYTFSWYNAAPTNNNITFIADPPTPANPPAMGAAPVIQTTEDLIGVPTGVYTLVVIDNAGCGNFDVKSVPALNAPNIVINKTDNTQCAPGQNGTIDVTVTGTAGTNYGISLFNGNDPATAVLETAGGPFNAMASVNHLYTGLLHDEYLVKIDDGGSPACPIYRSVQLAQVAFNPRVQAQVMASNTSCTPNVSADGSVRITVSSNTSAANANNALNADFEITSITPAPLGVFVPGMNLGLGGNATITGFKPIEYTIVVTDNYTGCTNTKLVTVPDVQDMPAALVLDPVAETFCSNTMNLSDGHATATLANSESTTHFNFTWATGATLGGVVFGPAAGDGAGTAGDLLNRTNATPANWPMGPTTGQGNGNRTFFAQAEKINHAPGATGVGCKTGIVQVVIPDQHISPNIVLTPTFDSFCLATSANGLVGDGQIAIAADSDPNTGGQQNAAGGFNYSWTTPNGALASPQNGQSNNFTIPQLGDGTYTITAVNATNMCLVTNNVTVVPAPYVLTIAANSKIDQRICNNDGEIRVTQIDLTDTRVGNPNSQSHSNAAIDPLYSFQWYNNAALTGGTELQDAVTPAPIVTRFLSHDANANMVVENGDYGAMVAGSYYVVATRTNPALPSFGCPTLPYRVDVQDVHVNPIPDLLVLSNTSCLPAGPGEGEIHIRVTDNSVAPFNTGTYTYDWLAPGPIPPAAPAPGFPNADPGAGNGDGLGNDDQYVQLMDNAGLGNANPYTVSITNTVTGCVTNAFATIIKNATPVFVQNATVTNEILCSPTGDGSITVTRVTLNDRTGATQEFVAAPAGPQGNISDFNFDWRRVGNPFVQTTAGTLLDKTFYDASGAGFNTPIGAGIYTVTARRNTGTPGAGCPSAPFQVEIKDMKIAPVVSLTPLANTSCVTGVAADMEGAIEVNVTDATTAPGITGFTYNWTTTPALTPIGPGAGDGDGLGTDGDDDNPTILADGGYSVTVTSDKSGCQGVGTATILKNTSPIFVQDVTVLNQILCGPDGQLTVASVSLNDRNGNSITFPPNISDFQFTWSRTGIAGTQVTAGTVLNSGNYVPANFAMNPIGFGEYSVVATRNTNGPGKGCSSAPYTVSILDRRIFPVVTMTPFANTSCSLNPALFEGEIDINVTDASPAVGPAGFDYTWNAGTGTALVSNNPANDGDGDGTDGDDDNPTTLREGTYNITVTSNKSACSTTAQTEIFKNSTPVFTQMVTPVDQIRCVADGSLTVNEVRVIDRNQVVQSSNTDFPIGDFEFTYSRTTVGNTIAGVTGTTLTVGNFPTIGADTYFVSARRVAGGPGLDCVSPPYKVDILNKALFPVVSLTPFANTACDPAFSEGSIEVRVSDVTTVPGPHTFSYTWNAGNPTAIAPSAANNGDGIATGDNDVPTGLFHGVYNMTVRNNQSQCVSPGSTELFRNSTPIIIPQATTTPQVLCSADGSITVSRVEVTDRNNNTFAAPFADFEFDWSHTTITPVVATTIGANPGGTTLNNVNYTSIERGQYFVVARRIAGNLGRGCVSAPFHATIDDLRVFPELTFTQEANSSCTNLAPNGELVANAREINGTNTGPYTFSWALNGGAVSPASVQTNTANASTLANALDGDYLVTATNTITSCPVTSPVTLVLDQSLSTPNIIEVTTIDPLDCNPTGQASVTRITLGSTTNSILFPPNIPPDNEISGAGLTAFDYEWFQGSVAPANQLPLGGPPFTTTPTVTSLLTGTYFVVVRDPATDCRSGARQVVINPDDIILPDLLVSQTALQISCRPGIGSAELSVTADGQDDTNPNYTFTWFGNDSTTPPSISTASTLSDIVAGVYSVTVHDNTTNCSISDSYIIEDDTQEFTPVVSMASQPRTLCVGTDGEIFARVLNLSPLYPYTPYTSATFTADLYFGANPNLSTAPNMPAIPNTVGFIGNFSQNNLNEGFYTVRITDNNTGCFSVATEELKDARQFPIVDIEEVAPVTNCDPVRPNGVARVTADNTFSGFTFDWYEGTAATGTPVYSGAEFGELKVKPQQYTVRATNVTSGCFTDKTTDIEDGTVPIPAATIEVLSNVTSCVLDNGALTAYVGTDKATASYIFHWYDGTVENPPADAIGENYNDRPIGNYSVTATSIVTGCKSPLVTAEIITEQEFPNFDFVIQNSTCDQQDGFASMILLTEVPLEKIEWFELSPEPSNGPIMEGPNMTDAGAGVYEIVATTFLGCSTTKQIEIKPDIRPYNGISRNNDGRNDIFQIDCIQNFPSNVVRVFNRAGTLVYEGESYDNSNTVFDGKSNKGISPMGVNLPDGTYYYIVDKRDGTKPIAGYLEIVQ